MASMGSDHDYCHFTKAVEHLGDRWSLQIVRQLILLGPQGFNALASAVPGISRSMLTDRLRKLEELGLVARDAQAGTRGQGYCLTPAGEQLTPVIQSLIGWARRWVPEDPAVAERDPDLIMWWLTRRVDSSAIPRSRVVIDLDIRGTRAKHFWLVLEQGAGPSVCIEDPLLGEDCYVYVEGNASAIVPIARGLRTWGDALADGSVELYGEPGLMRALPTWFRGVDRLAGDAAVPA